MATTELRDADPIETQEWLDAITAVAKYAGVERVGYLLEKLQYQAGNLGLTITSGLNTPYINTIPKSEETIMPEDHGMNRRVSALIRWNAVAMVLKAGKTASELGGHIASYASAAILYEVGFNYFFHAPNGDHGGDLIYIQGHSSPGIYARAFLEGRISAAQLKNFRQEITADGLPSYPHPWLMQDFWQFPTVSMGLGPVQAIYQARFLKYLQNRGLTQTQGRKVWAFLGDGEMDEPESVGALPVAVREKLDNLVFVINCNLQRLDGPVRGNGKIIQELESLFRGIGWRVIKVVWGGRWDSLFAKDKQGILKNRMEECVDGDYQAYKANDGAYVRKHFFGAYPELEALVADMSDEEIWFLNRGGHDRQKVYAAYAAAVKDQRLPTVILAKTVKGYGMGAAGEGQNITHQQKKMTFDELRAFRDRFDIPIADDIIEDIHFYRPADDSPEIKFIHQQRKQLGGYLPARRQKSDPLQIPDLDTFAPLTKGTGEHAISTTMAFVRILNILLKDKNIGQRIVPIVPDECRTFGMEGMFRQYGIYSAVGQLYTPEDAGQLMYYREAEDGQILEEGLTEAGAFCSWLAAATSYSTNNLPMIPFYAYYSMFGFQRIGDFAWAAGDMRARGFLMGATAGRTTLAGEGLQHQDGHSHILAATIPNCIAYDPTYAYELAVIIQNGMQRMMVNQEDVYYYLTIMNENYEQPAMPKGCEAGIIKGMYKLRDADPQTKTAVTLLGCGTILLEVIRAAELLADDFSIGAHIWSVTSFNELRRQARMIERDNRLRSENKLSYVNQCLQDQPGPVVAASDYMSLYADQIREFVPQRYVTLGTDGFGRSDTRAKLRHFFEVDAKYIVIAVLQALADDGQMPQSKVAEAIKDYGIDPDKPDPVGI